MTANPTLVSELEVAQKWLDITITRFIENMRKLRIQDTGALMASFQKQVVGSAEGRLQLRLSYALYGKFVDMGVGRGMGAGVTKKDDGYDRIRKNRGQLRRYARKKRNWYASEMGYQTKRLSELMLELYGQVLITTATDVAGETTINF
ncbi:MAG: hypothetical protein ACRYFZ_03690 [Janthinobacterium lividum]